ACEHDVADEPEHRQFSLEFNEGLVPLGWRREAFGPARAGVRRPAPTGRSGGDSTGPGFMGQLGGRCRDWMEVSASHQSRPGPAGLRIARPPWRAKRRCGMLEGLNAVEWGRLTHAYGEATDVPDLIRALSSNDEQQRDEAIEELMSRICHQGGVYDATT